jgi:hypothetical protein
MERIFLFEYEDHQVLGFNTGLDAAAFAKARLDQLLTRSGYAISPPPDFKLQQWKPKGVIEQDGSMIIWGPAFGEGQPERLDRLVTAAGSAVTTRAAAVSADQALDALVRWVRARFILPPAPPEGEETLPAPFPAGALLYSDGTILFPPEALLHRVIETEEWLTGAERWTHPDLFGDAADSFCAAALLYRILCGAVPFPAGDIETLHLDMREGNFLPPGLAVPGLDHTADAVISGALSRGKLAPAPDLKSMVRFLRTPPSGASTQKSRAASYFKPLSDEERGKLVRERERYEKKRSSAVKTRRFIKRNMTAIGGIAAAVLVLGLITGSLISDQGKRPTTKGLSPREVAKTYYYAMETLDHIMMEACILKKNKIGKDDITMVSNLTVLTRVREAYEGIRYMTARKWLEGGSAPTEALVFGPAELRIEDSPAETAEGEQRFTAEYTLWLSAEESRRVRDELRLVLYKGTWHIAEITRN